MGDVSFPSRRPPERGRSSTEPAAGAGAVRVFMFKGAGKRQYALTTDPSGRNIPRGAFGAGAWTLVRAVYLVAGEVRPGFDADEAVRAIREDGYALIGYPFDAD